MSPEEQEESASLYALGLLEGEQREAFEEELRLQPGLTRIVAEFQRGATQLATSLPKAAVPPTLRQTIITRIASLEDSTETVTEKKGFSISYWIPWGVAAALAIFCGVLSKQKIDLQAIKQRMASENSALQVNLLRVKTDFAALQERADKLEAEKSDLSVRLASLETHDPFKDVRPVILTPQPGSPSDKKLVALWDARQSAGCVNLDALPEPTAGRNYQMWIITPEAPQRPINAGVLASWKGHHVLFSSAEPVTQVVALAISVEPAGGSPSPQGPVVYVGKF